MSQFSVFVWVNRLAGTGLYTLQKRENGAELKNAGKAARVVSSATYCYTGIFLRDFTLFDSQASSCLGINGYFLQIPGLASYTLQE